MTLSSSRGAADTISAPPGLSDAAGQATFTVKTITAGSSTFTAVDGTDGVTVTQTAAVAFIPGAVSDLQSSVGAAPASVVADGVATSTVTVTLRDAFGNPVPGKAVTLSSSRGAADTISAASGASNPAGVVSFTVRTVTAGAATFVAVDSSDTVTVAQTATVTFTPGAVSVTQSTVSSAPGSVNADGATAAAITVILRDANGNRVSGKTVMLSSSRGALDTISAASGASDASGVVTFTVRSSTFGASTFTASDSSDALVLTQAASVSFSIYRLVFTTQPPGSTTAGVVLAPPLVVAAKDGAGNTDPGFVSNVTLAMGVNPGGATLGGTLTVAAASGVATFSDLSITRAASGYTLTASTSSGLTPATSTAFDVTPASPVALAFTIQPSNTGAGIRPTIQVSVQDAYGNPTSLDGAVVSLAIGSNPGAGTLSGTLTGTSSGGLATFTGLALTALGTGYTLVASAPGLTGATSAPFDVTAPRLVGSGTSASCTEAALNAALAIGGNITFSCGASPVTITLTSQKAVAVNTSLDGGGLVTLTGGGTTSLLSVNAGRTLALANLAISGGMTGGNGGAIYNAGTLSITDATFSGNVASRSNDTRGFSANGGALYNEQGTVLIASSTFSSNGVISQNDFYGASANGGALFTSGGRLLVTNSTFTGNTASASDAYYGTAGNGGAIFNSGGALFVTSSTFAGNAVYSTRNFYGTGGQGAALYGGARLTNTIVANSTSGANCAGTFVNGGHDLDSDGSCGIGAATNPLLDPAGLASNGGPTSTIAVAAASPAANAGDQAICAAAPVMGVDQRRYVRPGTGASACTIGAFEFNSVPAP